VIVVVVVVGIVVIIVSVRVRLEQTHARDVVVGHNLKYDISVAIEERRSERIRWKLTLVNHWFARFTIHLLDVIPLKGQERLLSSDCPTHQLKEKKKRALTVESTLTNGLLSSSTILKLHFVYLFVRS